MGKSRTQNGAGRLTAAHARRVPRAAAAAGRRPRLPPPPSLPLVPAPPRLQETARTNQTPPLFFRSFGLSQSPRTELHPDPALTNQPRETLTSLQPPPIGLRSRGAPIKSLRGSTCVDVWPMPCASFPVTNGGAVRGAQSGRGRAPGASGGGQWEFKQDRFCSTACYWAGDSVRVRAGGGGAGPRSAAAAARGAVVVSGGPRRWERGGAGPGGAELPTSRRVSR